MQPADFSKMMLDTVNQHIPPDAIWLPWAISGVTAVAGLVFMVKGARLAPILAALVFAVLGAGAGAFVPALLATPMWPTVAIGGVVGLLLGILLFKLWLAALVGVCLMAASLTVYSGQVLREPLHAYVAQGLDAERHMITLPEASGVDGVHPDWRAEVTQLWQYLSENVPNFQASVLAIALSTGLAGLIFGLLLPKLARAFWAASLGTLLFVAAVMGIVQMHFPAVAEWLGRWGLLLAATMWAISLAYNLVDMQQPRTKTAPAPPAPAKA